MIGRVGDATMRRRRRKELTAIVAVASFFAVMVLIDRMGPLDGWQLVLGLVLGVPYALWVLYATIEAGNGKRHRSYDQKPPPGTG
jgi:tryptophan-rich sensory protein